eukprot:g35172.t1
MKETITSKSVCGFYAAAGTYGLDSVKQKCFEWLLNNLMTHQSVDLLKDLSIGLMEKLISSPDLFVMQVEMDVYTALKKLSVHLLCSRHIVSLTLFYFANAL